MTGEVFYSLFVLRSETRFSKVSITFGAGAPKYQITKTKKKTEEEKRMGPIYERLTVATPTSRFAYVLFAYVFSLVYAQ